MNCPMCQKNMKEVRTSSHYGIPIVLDQCGECGGLWFDEDELYQTQHGAAANIEQKVDINKLKQLTLISVEDLYCPRDQSLLKLFKDKSFPESIRIEICSKCGGFWFNQGEFSQFQEERKKRLEKPNNEKKLPNSEELNKALDKRVLALLHLYNDLEKKRQKEEDKRIAETAVYLIWILLRMLLFKK